MLFKEALNELGFHTKLTEVKDGVELMDYLSENSGQLPDVLFLDLNMPLKSGFECFAEIKKNENLKALRIIINSTSLSREQADKFYEGGVYYNLPKPYYNELKEALKKIFTLITEDNFVQPPKEKFVLR